MNWKMRGNDPTCLKKQRDGKYEREVKYKYLNGENQHVNTEKREYSNI